MTLSDLIQQLTEASEELGPDAEVRLAHQPSYPFEYTIEGISTLHPHAGEIEEIEVLMTTTPRDDWPENAEQQLEALRSSPRVVWICEGDQIGYTTRDHWDCL